MTAPRRIWAAMPLDGVMKSETLYGWTTAEHLPEWQAENEAEIELGCDDPLNYVTYILEDPAALADSPEVQRLIAQAEARGYAQGWNAGMLTAASHVAEARNGHPPGPLFKELNKVLRKIESARFAAIKGEAE